MSLGQSEEEILHKLEDAIQSIIKEERELRGKLQGEAAERRTDRIARAEGIARYAKLLSSEEFFGLFTDLKMGVSLGLIPPLSHEALHTLFIHALPATLSSKEAEAPQNALERDRLRARLVRAALEVSDQ